MISVGRITAMVACSFLLVAAGATAARQPATSNQRSTALQNPCTLVTRAEVQAIFHSKIQHESEAPLGPTCVIQVRGYKQTLTIAIEVVNVSREIALMKPKPKRLSIRGHAAYCGVLGSSLLFVELSGGRALEVAAPCAAAEALASKALSRVA